MSYLEICFKIVVQKQALCIESLRGITNTVKVIYIYHQKKEKKKKHLFDHCQSSFY